MQRIKHAVRMQHHHVAAEKTRWENNIAASVCLVHQKSTKQFHSRACPPHKRQVPSLACSRGLCQRAPPRLSRRASPAGTLLVASGVRSSRPGYCLGACPVLPRPCHLHAHRQQQQVAWRMASGTPQQ